MNWEVKYDKYKQVFSDLGWYLNSDVYYYVKNFKWIRPYFLNTCRFLTNFKNRSELYVRIKIETLPKDKFTGFMYILASEPSNYAEQAMRNLYNYFKDKYLTLYMKSIVCDIADVIQDTPLYIKFMSRRKPIFEDEDIMHFCSEVLDAGNDDLSFDDYIDDDYIDDDYIDDLEDV